MSDWSLIRTTLSTWATAVTGLPCYWKRRPRPAYFGDSHIILDIIGRRTVGNDEVLTEYDDTAAAGSEIRRYQAGARQFTLTIRVNCQRTSDDVDALHYTSLIRDSVCLPETTEAAWKAAGVAFAMVLSEVEIDLVADDREQSIAQIDLLVNSTAIAEDVPTGYIELLDDFELYDPDNPVPPLWTGDVEVT